MTWTPTPSQTLKIPDHSCNDRVRKMLNHDDSPWKHLSLIGDEEVISLSHTGLRIFRFCVLLWKSEREPTIKYCLGREVGLVQKVHQNTVHRTQLMVSQWNSSGTSSQDSPHCNLSVKSSSCQKNERKAKRIYRTDHLHVDVQRHLMGISRQWTRMRIENQPRFLFMREDFAGRWSFLGPGSEKKRYSTNDSRPQGEWDRVAELMMINFGQSVHPVFHVTSPLSRGTLKSKGGRKLSTHFCADLVFAQLFLLLSSVSTEQFQICVEKTKPAM